MMAPSTKIEADRGDTNLYDFDANISIEPTVDKIWFTAKRRILDADADAVLRLGLNVPGLTGIVVTDAAAGLFQVQVPETVLTGITDTALIYDCQIYDASQDGYFTVQSGPMILSGQVTQSS